MAARVHAELVRGDKPTLAVVRRGIVELCGLEWYRVEGRAADDQHLSVRQERRGGMRAGRDQIACWGEVPASHEWFSLNQAQCRHVEVSAHDRAAALGECRASDKVAAAAYLEIEAAGFLERRSG